ncbi:MAG: carbonic anhydrase family protein [Oceanicaulis sp.]
MRFALAVTASLFALAACGPDEPETGEETRPAAELGVDEDREADVAGDDAVDDRTMGDEPTQTFSAEPGNGRAGMPPGGDSASFGMGGRDGSGTLSVDYEACPSTQNSAALTPEDTSMTATDAPSIDWRGASSASVVAGSHGVELRLEDAGGMTIDGSEYQLASAVFHADAAHGVDGEPAPLEAHFVHRSKTGDLAVVVMMFEVGEPNPQLNAILASLPEEGGEAELDASLDPASFLPPEPEAWRYEGPLTTPPCTGGVRWIVFKTPLTAAGEQIETLRERGADGLVPSEGLDPSEG